LNKRVNNALQEKYNNFNLDTSRRGLNINYTGAKNIKDDSTKI
jgi:hypothetical protein